MNIYDDVEGAVDLLLGNEAVARGAIEAGIDAATSYPGTPASEIMETLAEASSKMGFHVEWSANEKVAFEVSTGASMTGVRSLVSMKNAGLNWVMDPFMTIVYGGIRGGFVVVVADDPGAHYSSNEQDTRIAAAYAEIPCLEPADQQEAKEMTKYAFELSEKVELPVYVRLVTRVSHALGDVEFGEINMEDREPVFDRHYKQPYRWNVYGGSGPVGKHRWLKSQQPLVKAELEDVSWNEVNIPEGTDFGVIALGLASSYVREVLESWELQNEVAFLKLGVSHPLPEDMVKELLQNVEKVLIVEEGAEFVERRVIEIAKKSAPEVEVFGRLTGHVPLVGELNTSVVLDSLSGIMGIETSIDKFSDEVREEMTELLAPRSSTLCPGCPHLGTYWALRKAVERSEGEVQIVNGDIGCYEMGGYGIFAKDIDSGETEESQKYSIDSPYEVLDTNYVMGSGLGLMQGQFQAGYDDGPIIALAGDSTFFHAALPEVVSAVYNDVDGLFVVLDNRWASMTGHQPNPCTGERITGEKARKLDIEQVARALGVDHVQKVDACDIEEVTDAIQEGIDHDGFSMVISERVCTIQALRRDEFEGVNMEVNPEKCTGCRNCVELGCPAITFKDEVGGIDWNICVECGLCAQVCPTQALSIGGLDEES